MGDVDKTVSRVRLAEMLGLRGPNLREGLEFFSRQNAGPWTEAQALAMVEEWKRLEITAEVQKAEAHMRRADQIRAELRPTRTDLEFTPVRLPHDSGDLLWWCKADGALRYRRDRPGDDWIQVYARY